MSLSEFERSLELSRPLKGNKWFLGDLNWHPDHILIMKSITQSYNTFFEIIDDFDFTQMVNSPTHSDNILGLFLTTNPSLVSTVTVQAGTSDHIVITQARLKPCIKKESPPKHPIIHENQIG